METVSQIKNNLISKIKNSEDLIFLKAIQTIFESKNEQVHKLTKEQKESIEIGREDILNGDYQTHESLMNEAKQWLKKQ